VDHDRAPEVARLRVASAARPRPRPRSGARAAGFENAGILLMDDQPAIVDRAVAAFVKGTR
jgi:hypothetical protein